MDMNAAAFDKVGMDLGTEELFEVFKRLNVEAKNEFLRLINKKSEMDYSIAPQEIYAAIKNGASESVSPKDELEALKKENERLQNLAYKNPISGLKNKLFYNEMISNLVQSGKQFVIAVMDLNQLKEMNDTFGHLIVDKLINIVASRIESNVRENDIVTHWGGDEFVIVLNCELKKAKKIVKRIQNACNAPVNLNGTIVNPTISAGVSFVNSPESYEQAFELADKAMYINKIMLKNGFSFKSATVCRYDEALLNKFRENLTLKNIEKNESEIKFA